jgi:hypothetical protein
MSDSRRLTVYNVFFCWSLFWLVFGIVQFAFWLHGQRERPYSPWLDLFTIVVNFYYMLRFKRLGDKLRLEIKDSLDSL